MENTFFCTSFAKLLPGEYRSSDNSQIVTSSMYFSALVLWAMVFTRKTIFYATFLGSSSAACGLLTTLGLHAWRGWPKQLPRHCEGSLEKDPSSPDAMVIPEVGFYLHQNSQ